MIKTEALNRLDGVFVPMFTPFVANGATINEEQLRANTRSLIKHGIRILNPAGTTGEFWQLTPQEHQRVLCCVIEEARAMDPDVMVVAGASCQNLALTLDMARFAADRGASFLQLVPPYYLPMSEDDLVAYYKAICEIADIGVMIYEMPKATGVRFHCGLLARICEECPSVVGLKTASPDYDLREFERIVRRFGRRLAIFAATGLYYSTFTYMAGAAGITDTMANAAPAFGLELHRLARARQWERMNELYQEAFDVLEIEVIYGKAGLKEIGNVCGLNVGPTRYPMVCPLTEADRKDIRARLADWSFTRDLVLSSRSPGTV